MDHKNGIRGDNRKDNLRLCTCQQNTFNTKPHKDNKYSTIKGVSFLSSGTRTKRWRARIHVDGKEKHLGYFLTEKEAVQVAIEAQKQHHKEFMYTDEEIRGWLT